MDSVDRGNLDNSLQDRKPKLNRIEHPKYRQKKAMKTKDPLKWEHMLCHGIPSHKVIEFPQSMN